MNTDNINPPTHCPDCGAEYKSLEEMLPPASEPEIREVSESDVVADLHRELECPMQKEKELVGELKAALTHFGFADTLRRLLEIAEQAGQPTEGGDVTDAVAPHREKLALLANQCRQGAHALEDILLLYLGTDLDTPEGEEMMESFVSRNEERIKRLLRMN